MQRGGVELAHQLVDHINNSGGLAYIVYEKEDQISPAKTITPAYQKYNIKVADHVEDDCDNMIILPEFYFDWIFKYKKINIGLWWMSVDNRYMRCHWTEALLFNKPIRQRLKTFKKAFESKCKNRLSDLKLLGDRGFNFYQSVYAQNHLYSKGFTNVFPLSDYINEELCLSSVDNISRENIVLYNPGKGLRFTKHIIANNPDVKFIALRGFSRTQLRDLMHKAKIYIDFGNFPGKDRLPREAILNGLCVITGNAGASFFFEDVPIPSKYKYSISKKNIPVISNLIREIFENFNDHYDKFTDWKTIITEERNIFYKQIDTFFFKKVE